MNRACSLPWCSSNIFPACSHYHPAGTTTCLKPDAIKPPRQLAHPDTLLPDMHGTHDASNTVAALSQSNPIPDEKQPKSALRFTGWEMDLWNGRSPSTRFFDSLLKVMPSQGVGTLYTRLPKTGISTLTLNCKNTEYFWLVYIKNRIRKT